MHYGASSVAAGQIQRFFFGQGRKYGEGGKIVSCLAREPRLRSPTKKVRPFPYFRQCPKNPSLDHDSSRDAERARLPRASPHRAIGLRTYPTIRRRRNACWEQAGKSRPP